MLYYCGSAPAERVERALTQALRGLPERSGIIPLPMCGDAHPVQEIRSFEDALDVTQGKLALGWRTGGITIRSAEYPALLVLNAVYGGTTTSKLFMNVRERLSLCYYASSALDKQKGLMLVSSGVEFGKVDQAREEILAQFRLCAAGDFTLQELEAARRAVVSGLTAGGDSQSLLEYYWQTQAASGQCRTPEELIELVEQVTKEQVVAAAGKMQLDTIYFLKGRRPEPWK